ncbi:hypothetical protein B0H19DRAFT_1077436 [Mycena capillaripes]|nr:hypothetical protein B0H19DRAFT_1077436 [Mycena capillaripes]
MTETCCARENPIFWAIFASFVTFPTHSKIPSVTRDQEIWELEIPKHRRLCYTGGNAADQLGMIREMSVPNKQPRRVLPRILLHQRHKSLSHSEERLVPLPIWIYSNIFRHLTLGTENPSNCAETFFGYFELNVPGSENFVDKKFHVNITTF